MILDEFTQITSYNCYYVGQVLGKNKIPGYVKIFGGDNFIQSPNFTDIATFRDEMIAVKDKAQKWALARIKDLKERLPFTILEFDSDNSSEFISMMYY
ncbi:MAG: hypothetical protein Kow00103_01170 [Candidatus Caldatribacteriota bacterium]